MPRSSIQRTLKETISRFGKINLMATKKKLLQIKINIGRWKRDHEGETFKKMESQMNRWKRRPRTNKWPTDRTGNGLRRGAKPCPYSRHEPKGNSFQLPRFCHQGANTRHPNRRLVETERMVQTRILIGTNFLI